MYYQNYEDYMRQVLGYPINDPNIYETYNFANNQTYEDTYYLNRNQVTLSEEEIMACYPEIYNKIYPMICKMCDSITQPITKELIEQITDQIYNNAQKTDTIVNVRIEGTKSENRSDSAKREDNLRTSRRDQIKTSPPKETRQTNFLLRDLIKILIINRILQQNRPSRPRPPRPPYPGMPGRPPYNI